jgi:two-component system, LuxR family, response regulator FixJ
MAMPADRSTVFIVDDDPSVREAVAALVESMSFPAQTFASAEEFLQDYDPGASGCLVTDLRMLGMSGLDLLERLKDPAQALPVIIITAYADVPLAIGAMKRGAFSLLQKPCRDHDLWSTIHDALEADSANRSQHAAKQDLARRLASLTPDEQQVMQWMARGLSNKVIAMELDVSVRTVVTRRRNVFEKLSVESVAELVNLLLTANRCPS